MHFSVLTQFVALAVLAAATPRPVKQGTTVSIPITKRSALVNSDNSVNFEALHAHVASVKAKIHRGLENYKRNTGEVHPSAKQGVEKRGAGGALNDYSSELWYGTIEVGTPAQIFTVDFDTGSSDLFLPGSGCGSGCGSHTLWDPSSSSSASDLGQTFTLTYGDGSSSSGELYTDTVSLAGFSATDQTLGAATAYSTEFQNFPADGLMGMGFQHISKFGASPVFQTLVSNGQVDPEFSFKLSSSGAELFVGGSNPSLYTGGFTYVPVTEQGYWQVIMDSVQGNGQTILQGISSIIDTGTTLVIGDPSDVASLYDTLGGVAIGGGFYTFPCDSFPTISFTFGGTSFPIPASTLNYGQRLSGSSDCVSGLVGIDMGIYSWIIGDIFLQGVYTTFDFGNSQVGFAQLS